VAVPKLLALAIARWLPQAVGQLLSRPLLSHSRLRGLFQARR